MVKVEQLGGIEAEVLSNVVDQERKLAYPNPVG